MYVHYVHTSFYRLSRSSKKKEEGLKYIHIYIYTFIGYSDQKRPSSHSIGKEKGSVSWSICLQWRRKEKIGESAGTPFYISRKMETRVCMYVIYVGYLQSRYSTFGMDECTLCPICTNRFSPSFLKRGCTNVVDIFYGPGAQTVLHYYVIFVFLLHGWYIYSNV